MNIIFQTYLYLGVLCWEGLGEYVEQPPSEVFVLE